jgi:hypothetical protein
MDQIRIQIVAYIWEGKGRGERTWWWMLVAGEGLAQ